MKNKLLFFVFLLALFSPASSCSDYPDSANREARLSIDSPALPLCSYDYEKRLIGNYDKPSYADLDVAARDASVPSQFFTATVDLEHEAGYTEQGNIRADDVAELAWFMVQIHHVMDLPNNDLVYDALVSSHFIVTNSEAGFINLRDGTEISEEWDLAFLYILGRNNPCWQMPNDARWTSVIPAEYFISDDVSVIVHEMVHVVAEATYGSPNADHENHDLWSRWSSQSLMSRTIQAYENKYWPGQCWSDR